MKNMSDHPTTLRRLLAAAFMCVTLVLAGCGDDELEGRVDDLENRVASLETLCDEMNTNISSLQTLLAAIQDGDYVTGVTPVTEGSLTIGYTITFARHQPVIVYNGENGSSLSIRQDSDGEYYWIMNGDWLLDKEGNKMNTSEKIPLLRIEEGQWLISVDDGDSWENMGQVTGAFFKSIDNSSDDHIDIVLADGTTVTIPKKLTFAITFSETLPRIAPGETIELAYTLSQGDDATLVKTVTSNGWKAEVIKKDNLSGTIRITAPTPITDDEVLVFISDGKEKTVMSAISFTILIVENAPDNTIQVSGGGGDLNIEVTANLPVSASSPDSWIQPVQDPQSRALAINLFRFTVQANENESNRTGSIQIKNADGSVLQTLTITQGNALDEILAREREILTIFYYSTNGDQWLRKDNWLSDKPLYEWYGIDTDQNGVWQMDLGDNKLSGVIPPVIGELSNLQDLLINNYRNQSLDDAQLTGQIPPEIGKLQNLKQLVLVGNKLSGNIPEEIGNMANLGRLDLSSNQLSGSIPSSIGKLTKLTYLDLSGNRLTGSIPRVMGNMTALQVFLINGGYITGAGGGSVTVGDSIDITTNQISGEIPVEFARLPNLENFSAIQNRLSGNIPEEIWKPSLCNLLLDGNQLTGSLPPAIRNAQNLRQLWLRNNLLTGELPDELCELPNLEELILGNATHSRGSEIQEFNHFEGPIPENIGNLKKLRQLDISTAGISGEIPASICELSNLEVICLGNATAEVSNYLTGKLPADIGKLKNLSGFDVSNNNIEGTIPAGFAELSQLSSLFLYGNRLQGLIPQELINSPRWSSWNPDVFILPQQPGYFLFTEEGYVSTDFSADGEFYALQTATQGDGVDIVFIGDGFTDVDITNGAYETAMRQAMENFFAREQY